MKFVLKKRTSRTIISIVAILTLLFSFIPINKAGAVPPPPVLPVAVIEMTPMTGLTPTTNIVFSDRFSVGTITAREWRRNSDAITPTPPNGTFPAGRHVIRLRVRDANGEFSGWASKIFNVTSNTSATITMTPQTDINITTALTFTANTTSDGLPVIAHEWQRNRDAITVTPPNGIFTAGGHTVRLRVRNSAGAWSRWSAVSFRVTARPTTSISMIPQTNLTTATDIKFNRLSSAHNQGTITAWEWQRNSDAITIIPPNGRFPAGNHTVRLRVMNNVGLWSAWASVNFNVISVPAAIISMTPPTNVDTATSVIFSANTTSNGLPIVASEWRRNNEASTSFSPSGTFPAGGHAVRLRVQNSAGVWSPWESISFRVTTRLAAVIGMTPQVGITTANNVVFNHFASTPGQGTITAAEWQRNSDAITATVPSGAFPAGNHTVRLRVQNSAGTWSAWASRTFNVAGIPVATIAMTPSTGITTATSITFSDPASTAGEGTITAREWQRNSDAITTTPPSGMFLVGNHTVRLRVRNSVGTWSAWASRTFNVAGIPVATITSTPLTGLNSMTSVTFSDPTSTPGEGTITAREWQRNSDAITATPPSGRFIAGSHTVRLRVRNSVGTWSAWASVSFSVIQAPPWVSFGMSPATGIRSTTNVAFLPIILSPGVGGIAIWEWRVVGQSVRPTPPNGTFPVGTHIITVRARDAAGTWSSTESRSFTVTP